MKLSLVLPLENKCEDNAIGDGCLMAKIPQQIALLGGVAGLSLGLLIGFFAGREHLRAEFRQGLVNAFGGSKSDVAPAPPKSKIKSKGSTGYSAIRTKKMRCPILLNTFFLFLRRKRYIVAMDWVSMMPLLCAAKMAI